MILGTAILTLLVLAAYRLLFFDFYKRQEHRKRLTLLGSMAANVAHEIRNPLASIKGAAQFVEKELESLPPENEAREYLRMIVKESDRLDQVVENFLDFARPLTPRLKEVQVSQLVEDIVKTANAAGKGGIECETNGSPVLSADPELIRTALGNIIRNAVQAAGENGKVRVTVRQDEGSRGQVAIDVEDDGPGVPKDKLEEIFQPFMTTKTRGTGLGLAIAMRIAEGHGGEIKVKNLEPHGARFTLLLPARAQRG